MMAKTAPDDISYGSVGLMVGLQDPMMGFPKDTLFSAYAALRNAGDHPLTVKPVLFLMEGGKPRTVKLPPEHFAPGEARQLSFARTLSNFNGMATLTFTYGGHPGDLLIATGSVDQTGTYVFEVMPDGLGTTWAKNAPFWRVTGGLDSMLTVFNPQDAPAEIVLKLTYVGGTGHYAVPLHLAAGETQMLDVAQLIEMQQPDGQSNVIPRDITEGSAQFAGPKGQTQEIRIGVSAGVFNVQTATCGGGCLICTSTVDTFIDANPIDIPLGSSQQAFAFADLSDGSEQDETISAFWNSDNGSVATVQSGLVQAVAVGSAVITATFQSPDASDPPPEGCSSSCPTAPSQPQATANVKPKVSITGASNFAFIGSDPSIPRVLQQAVGKPSGGTYSWTATPTNRISFDNASSDVVAMSGINPSTSVGDTTLTVTYTLNNQSAQATSSATSRIFLYVTSSQVTVPIPNGNYGYEYNLTYDTYTCPGGQLLQPGFSGISVPETVSVTSTNIPGATTHTGTGGTNSNSEFVDTLALISNQPIPSNVSEIDSQDIFVGGIFVRNNTLTYSSTTVTVGNNGPTACSH
jgi:hypothetical protein